MRVRTFDQSGRRSPARTLLLSVGVLALAATGCASVPEGAVEAAGQRCPEGSDCYDVPRAIGEGGTLTVDAGEFFFRNIAGVYWAGDIEVTLNNVGAAEHNIVFTGSNEGSEVPQALGGETATAIVNLFEGEYVYFCSIPGHRAQGMEGVLEIFPTQADAEENLTEAPTDGSTETETEAETETGEPTDASTDGATETATPAPTATSTEG